MGVLSLAEKAARGAARLRGVATREVATPAARVHVYDAPGRGSLPPVAVLHGLATSAAPFLPLVEALRPHARRVVAPELPGHGFSPPPAGPLTPTSLYDAMSAALDGLLDAPAVVYGASLGGAVALRYALERPERVRALVLGSPAGARLDPAAWEALVARFDLRTAADARAFLGRLYHRAPWFAPLVAADVQRIFARDAVRDLLLHARPDDLFEPERLASLRVPVLLLWGRSERLLPPECLAWFRAHLPRHARIEEPYGFGHSPHVDDPRRLAARIVEFAREHCG